MAGLAEQLDANHRQAAITQQALRNNRRVIRHNGGEPEPDDNAPHRVIRKKLNHSIVVEAPAAQSPVSNVPALPIALPHAAITASPLDLPAEHFSAGLDRRKQNRQVLMDWLHRKAGAVLAVQNVARHGHDAGTVEHSALCGAPEEARSVGRSGKASRWTRRRP